MRRKYNLSPDDLRRMYHKNIEITDEDHEKLVDLWSDISWVEGIHSIVKTQVEKSSAPTYLYQFSYDKGSPLKRLGHITTNGKTIVM